MDRICSEALKKELKGNYLFQEFSDEQLLRLVDDARLRNLAKNEQVFAQGESAACFYLLRSGQIKLYRVSSSGQEKVIDLIRPGQTFGESTLFADDESGQPIFADAIEPSVVLTFSCRLFRKLLSESVKTCFRLMGAMSQRLHQQINEIDRLTLHDATYRLVIYLLEQVPEGVVASPRVFLSTSKSVIASRLSIQPETFSRILSRLAKQNLIDVHGNYIEVRDIPALREMLGRGVTRG